MIKQPIPAIFGHGQVKFTRPDGQALYVPFKNTTTTALMQQIITYYCDATGDPQAKIVEWGGGSNAADPSDTDLHVPKSRTNCTATDSGVTFTLDGFFSGVSGTHTATGTITAGADEENFTSSGSHGLVAGQWIEVTDATPGISQEQVKILSVSTNDITLDPSTPLSATPTATGVWSELVTEIGIWGGTGASATLGTGTLYARAILDTFYTKPQFYSLDIEWQGGFS